MESPRSFTGRQNSLNQLFVSPQHIKFQNEQTPSQIKFNEEIKVDENVQEYGQNSEDVSESQVDYQDMDQQLKLDQIKLDTNIKKKNADRKFQRKLEKLKVKSWTQSQQSDQIKAINTKNYVSGAESSIIGCENPKQIDEENEQSIDQSYSIRKSMDSNMIKMKKMRKFQKYIDAEDNLKSEHLEVSKNKKNTQIKDMKINVKQNSNETVKPSNLFSRRAKSFHDKNNFSEFGKDMSITDVDKDLASLSPVILTSQNSVRKEGQLQFKMNLPPKLDQRAYDRRKRFEFTRPSKYEMKYRRVKAISNFLFFLYMVVVSIFVWQLNNGENSILPDLQYPKYISYVLLGLGLNLLMVFPVIFIGLKTSVFPYNFWVVRDIIVGDNCISYSQDFATLIERSYILMCTNALQKVQANDEEFDQFIESDYLKEKKEQFKDVLSGYDNEDCNIKFNTLFSLLQLYSVTNLQVIQRLKAERRISSQIMSRKFNEISAVLEVMASIFTKLQCKLTNPFTRETRDLKFGDYYLDEFEQYSDRMIPIIQNNDYNREQLALFETCVIKFRDIVQRSNNPINLLCCRCNCFGLFFFNIFHSNDQMEQMLQNNFDGRRFEVKATDGINLDCMFFPFNDEKVKTIQEFEELKLIKDEEQGVFIEPEYLKYPTLIFFNMNAQCYQQQVHSPNAFWLKFFASNEINVLAWNYRNYGRSEGQPDPYTSYHDAETILKFLIQGLGIKGKIGCFGRSIGGTIATHLANNYPQHIEFLFVDRSLGNLIKVSDSMIRGSCNQTIFRFFLYGGWNVRSDINFFETKCFKMLTQDPNDEMIDQSVALNAWVAREACKQNIGEDRYHSLKINKTYNALRLVHKIESRLFILHQRHLNKIKKQLAEKRKNQKKILHDYYESNGYNDVNDQARLADVEQQIYYGGGGYGDKRHDSDRSAAGYSTDADTFSRTKRLLEMERKWIRIIQNGELTNKQLEIIMIASITDNFKQYESFSILLEKAIVFINDLSGGIIKLGWIMNSNNPFSVEKFVLFIDCLFTYGSDYIDQPIFANEVLKHRDQRLKSIKNILEIIKTLHLCKDEVKNMSFKRPNDSLRWLIVATLSILIKFFEQLKKQLKKSEMHINFGAVEIGHLIPLSVGHKNKPTDPEINYIHKMIKFSGFQYTKDEITESISPDKFIQSSILPTISPSPNPLKQLNSNRSGRDKGYQSEYNPATRPIRLEKNENSFIISGSDGEYKTVTDKEKGFTDGYVSKYREQERAFVEKKVTVLKKKFKLTLHATSMGNEQVDKLKKIKLIQEIEKNKLNIFKKFEQKRKNRLKSMKRFKQYASDTEKEQNEEPHKKELFRLNLKKNKTPLNLNQGISFLKTPIMKKAQTLRSPRNRQAQKKKNEAKEKIQKIKSGKQSYPIAKSEFHKSERNLQQLFQSEMQSNKSFNSKFEGDEEEKNEQSYQIMSSNSNLSDTSNEPWERKSFASKSAYSKSLRNSIPSKKSQTNDDVTSQITRKSLYKQIKELTKIKTRQSKIQEENRALSILSQQRKNTGRNDQSEESPNLFQRISNQNRRSSCLQKKRPQQLYLAAQSQSMQAPMTTKNNQTKSPFKINKYEYHKFSPKINKEIMVDEITSEEEVFMAEKSYTKKQLSELLLNQEDVLMTEHDDNKFRLNIQPVENVLSVSRPQLSRTQNPNIGNYTDSIHPFQQ